MVRCSVAGHPSAYVMGRFAFMSGVPTTIVTEIVWLEKLPYLGAGAHTMCGASLPMDVAAHMYVARLQ